MGKVWVGRRQGLGLRCPRGRGGGLQICQFLPGGPRAALLSNETKGQQTFSRKGSIVRILGCAGHAVLLQIRLLFLITPYKYKRHP